MGYPVSNCTGVRPAWSGGLAEWQEGDTVYLSVAFTWLLDEAWRRAMSARSLGWKVRAGGPALFLVKMQHKLADVAELGGDYPEAVTKHNPWATFATAGISIRGPRSILRGATSAGIASVRGRGAGRRRCPCATRASESHGAGCGNLCRYPVAESGTGSTAISGDAVARQHCDPASDHDGHKVHSRSASVVIPDAETQER